MKHQDKVNWRRQTPGTNGRKRKPCRLYRVWDGMRTRCLNPNARSYRYHGGKGIQVCDEWSDYAAFRAWAIANGYRKGLTIERIDNDGHYAPWNCRWVTRAHQQFNTSRVNMLTIDGVTKSLPEWARIVGIPANTINYRLRLGWSHEHAVMIPVGISPQGRGRSHLDLFRDGNWRST